MLARHNAKAGANEANGAQRVELKSKEEEMGISGNEQSG